MHALFPRETGFVVLSRVLTRSKVKLLHHPPDHLHADPQVAHDLGIGHVHSLTLV
jgi:hypothetical protein